MHLSSLSVESDLHLCGFTATLSRAVIDLSDVEPDELLNSWDLWEEIPQCAVVTRRKKKSSKDSPKDEPDESLDGSRPDESRDQSPDGEEKSHDKSHDDIVFPEEEEEDEGDIPYKSSDYLSHKK